MMLVPRTTLPQAFGGSHGHLCHLAFGFGLCLFGVVEWLVQWLGAGQTKSSRLNLNLVYIGRI